MKWPFIFMMTCYPYIGTSQDYPRKEIDLTRVADELYGVQDLDLNYEDLYENLVQLLSHPVNLNRATSEELRFLKVLSEAQIKNLLDYRQENENFLSVYELQAIPGFDLETISRLAPFVKVIDPVAAIDASLWRRVRKESNNYFLIRYERTLQTSSGYKPITLPSYKFKGSPDKVYLRFRSNRPGDFSIGFTAEKDAGEALQWNPSRRYYGIDYLSFHLQIQNKGRLKNLVIGDFQSQFGQGLMLGGIFGMGKGGETITTVRRSNIGVLPYTSVYEAGYLRGIAATFEVVRNFSVTGFYSNTLRDANLSIDTVADSFIASFQTTGFHRNENELSKRKRIGDNNWGAVFQYKIKQLDAGIIFNAVKFDAPVVRNRTVYNQFAFQGMHNRNAGFFLNYTFQNLALFTEASHTIGNGSAFIGGILWSLTPKLDLSVVYRKFDRDYHTFYSNAFAENSNTQNESGIYWGWKYRLNQKISIAGYIDFFEFPWLRYRGYSPSSGHEWLLRFSYQPSRKVMIFLQGREESKDRNISDENSTLYFTSQGRKNNYWVSCDFGLRQKLHLKTRAQFSTYHFNGRTTTGFALMQDIQAETGRFQFTFRYALYNTDDYDNRQYVYENDVLLAYSMPAYYGIGVRRVAMIEYKMNRYLSFWFRYAHTRYPFEEKIGSGVDTIEGNIRNDVKFQVRLNF